MFEVLYEEKSRQRDDKAYDNARQTDDKAYDNARQKDGTSYDNARLVDEKLLYVVGIGPGGGKGMTHAAARCIEKAETIVGYHLYIDLIRKRFPGKEFLTTGMTQEFARCRLALLNAASGKVTAIVCSGDPGIYGMAAPVYELLHDYPDVKVKIVPGVTAASAGAALLGAPLSGDFAVISLSDRLVEWETIEKRLLAAADAGFSIAIYNPSSKGRPEHLHRACEILMKKLSPETVCGIVKNIDREGECCEVMTLGKLSMTETDMFTTAFIGTHDTLNIGGKMVTPRGYRR